jgi:hypothetical protein
VLKEKDMMVTGGLTWWKDFICVACFNMLDQRDEVCTGSVMILVFYKLDIVDMLPLLILLSNLKTFVDLLA